MAFLALEKNRAFSIIRLRAQEVMLTEREKPDRAIETRRKSRNSFFENETIFVFIMSRSWANYKKILNARSAANQSALTIVAI